MKKFMLALVLILILPVVHAEVFEMAEGDSVTFETGDGHEILVTMYVISEDTGSFQLRYEHLDSGYSTGTTSIDVGQTRGVLIYATNLGYNSTTKKITVELQPNPYVYTFDTNYDCSVQVITLDRFGDIDYFANLLNPTIDRRDVAYVFHTADELYFFWSNDLVQLTEDTYFVGPIRARGNEPNEFGTQFNQRGYMTIFSDDIENRVLKAYVTSCNDPFIPSGKSVAIVDSFETGAIPTNSAGGTNFPIHTGLSYINFMYGSFYDGEKVLVTAIRSKVFEDEVIYSGYITNGTKIYVDNGFIEVRITDIRYSSGTIEHRIEMDFIQDSSSSSDPGSSSGSSSGSSGNNSDDDVEEVPEFSTLAILGLVGILVYFVVSKRKNNN